MGDLTMRVQGLVDRIETVPDGKYVHIWIKEAQKPLTITANELEKGFKPKPGERIWAEANEGKKWLFIKRYGHLAETRVGLAPSPVRYWQPEYPPQDSPVNLGYYPEFPVDGILSSRFSFRQDITEGIQDLMSEIHAAGLIIQPLICRPSSKPGHVEVGPGERRLYAARQVGMKTVPIVVKAFSDFEFDKIRLLENLARKDLTDMETARVLNHLLEKYPKEYPTQEALANAFNRSRQWVSQHLDMLLLKQPENMSKFTRVNLQPEELTEGQAREILSTPEEKRQEVIEKIAEEAKTEGKIPSMRRIREIAKPGAVKEPSSGGELPSRFGSEPTPETREDEPLLTGFEVECPECHKKLLINHIDYATGKTCHEVELVK